MRRDRERRRSALGAGLTLGLVLALVACDATPGEGELGNDRFYYACVDPDDAACDAGEATTLEAVPVVAKGSVFRLINEEPSNAAFCPTARLAVVPGEPVTFRAEVAGFAAVFARESDRDVRDLFHVEVAAPSYAALLVREADTPWVKPQATVAVPVGGSAELRVVPADAKGRVLAGALDWSWSSTPADLLDAVATVRGNVLLLAPKEISEGELVATGPNGLSATVEFAAVVAGGGR